jgi:hypothetical protein
MEVHHIDFYFTLLLSIFGLLVMDKLDYVVRDTFYFLSSMFVTLQIISLSKKLLNKNKHENFK